jgi:transposase-like protein
MREIGALNCDVVRTSRIFRLGVCSDHKRTFNLSTTTSLSRKLYRTRQLNIKMADQSGMVDPAIFQDLQARVDEDTVVRDVS